MRREKNLQRKGRNVAKVGFTPANTHLIVFVTIPPNESVYHEVEMSGDIEKGDSKICSTKIKVGARLSIAGLVKAAIDFTMAKTKKENDATGYCGASSATDSTGLAVAWGYEAKAKGKKGAHLVLADWRYIGKIDGDGDYCTPQDKDCWKFAGAKMLIVDGDKIKEDTYYSLRDGILLEVKTNNN